MRYEPLATERVLPWATRTGTAAHRPVSTVRPGDRHEVVSLQAAELDIWEDEGGTTMGRVLGFPGRHAEQNFDEFSG